MPTRTQHSDDFAHPTRWRRERATLHARGERWISNPVLAARFLIRARALSNSEPRASRTNKGEAERRTAHQPMSAPHIQASPPACVVAARASSGAHAFRRSTAALAKALTPWLSSRPALHGIGMCDHPSPRAASSSRAGRSASRAGSRSRPSAGLRAPRAGTAPAPLQGSSREAPR